MLEPHLRLCHPIYTFDLQGAVKQGHQCLPWHEVPCRNTQSAAEFSANVIDLLSEFAQKNLTLLLGFKLSNVQEHSHVVLP